MASVESIAPTLARLSFWVSPEQMAEFEGAYEQHVVPLLKQHGLVVSFECGRQTVAGVFSQLFAVETPAEIAVKENGMERVPLSQIFALSSPTPTTARASRRNTKARSSSPSSPPSATRAAAAWGCTSSTTS